MKKKIFTLFAFLAMFMGANAANWVKVAELNFGQYTGFPHYVMGYVPEFYGDGLMTDCGGQFSYKTDDEMTTYEFAEGESEVGTVLTQGGVTYHKIQGNGTWHQYFVITGFPTQIDGHYRVVAKVKASEACEIPMQMRWSWSVDPVNASASIGTDWAEVEWEYTGINGNQCDLIAQPNTQAQIQWEWIEVYEDQREQRPVTWQEWLTSDGKPVVVTTTPADIPTWKGNAETDWADPNVAFNDQTQNYLICAWSKERGRNMDDEGNWNPFPADIEMVDGSNVFVVHGKPAITDGDASAWDNQFWIQSPKAWKSGDVVKIHFRYKASAPVSSTDTQIHNQNPSDYLIWHAIGNIAFTTEWQEFDATMTFADDMAAGWSIAFNLNTVVKDAVDFYFDDLSWQSMVLDEGFFVAGCDPQGGLEYDFDNAVQFEDGVDVDGAGCLVATIGSKDAYVSQVMISTIRGNDAAFKSNTIKPIGTITNDASNWMDYAPSTNAKLTLPGLGIWKIYLDPDYGSVAFQMIEGQDVVIKEITPNPTEITVEAGERDFLPADNNGDPVEEQIGTGQPWDNQFWLVAGRTLSAGERLTVKFKYKADKAAKASTQSHGDPGAYLHWAAIGDVNFTEEWQDFENTFTVASEANGMKSIAFNLSEIKGANNYYIKDVIWMTEDGIESLIPELGIINNTDGSVAFVSKVNQGDNAGQILPAGISSIVSDKKATNVTYNLAGQRVTKGYKGIVIKNGAKYIVK